VLNIVEETCRYIKEKGFKMVALLATRKTIREKLYERYLNGIELLTPDDKELERITRIILNILAGRKKRDDKKYLEYLIKRYRKKGVEAVILGCTELPLILRRKREVIDSLQILAEAVVRECVKEH
jgi:aspartate racemase